MVRRRLTNRQPSSTPIGHPDGLDYRCEAGAPRRTPNQDLLRRNAGWLALLAGALLLSGMSGHESQTRGSEGERLFDQLEEDYPSRRRKGEGASSSDSA